MEIQNKYRNSRFIDPQLITSFLFSGLAILLLGILSGTDYKAFSNTSFPTIFARSGFKYSNIVSFGGFFLLIIGICYYIFPKLTGKTIFLGSTMGWVILAGTIVCSLSGLSLIFNPEIQVSGFGNTPSFINELFLLILLLTALVMGGSVLFREERKIHISLSFFLIGFGWVILNWILLSEIIPHFAHPKITALLQKGFTFYLFLLFTVPCAFGIIHFLIPSIAQKPVFSVFLSQITFWTLTLILPFAGCIQFFELGNEYVFLVKLGQFFCFLLAIPLVTLLFNFYLTFTGNWKKIHESLTARMFFLSINRFIFLLLFIAILHGWNRYDNDFSSIFGTYTYVPAGLVMLIAISALFYIFPRVCSNSPYSSLLSKWIDVSFILGFGLLIVSDSLVVFVQYSLMHYTIDNRIISSIIKPFIRLHSVSMLIVAFGVFLTILTLLLTLFKGKSSSTIIPEFKELKYKGKEVEEIGI